VFLAVVDHSENKLAETPGKHLQAPAQHRQYFADTGIEKQKINAIFP